MFEVGLNQLFSTMEAIKNMIYDFYATNDVTSVSDLPLILCHTARMYSKTWKYRSFKSLQHSEFVISELDRDTVDSVDYRDWESRPTVCPTVEDGPKLNLAFRYLSIFKRLSLNFVTILLDYLVIWQQPWKFREIPLTEDWLSILKVRPFHFPFDM